ncbi:DUF6132 family protein [Bacteroidota bacterium]
MKTILKKHWKTGLFILGGAIIGFAYWRFIGCTSGTCPLTSNWHSTTLFGGLIGMMASPANRKSSTRATPEQPVGSVQAENPAQPKNTNQ